MHLGERSGLDLGPDTEQRLAMHAVYVEEYDIVDAGRVRDSAEWIGRTDLAATGEIGAAVRSNRTTTKPSEKGCATMKLTTTAQVSVDGVMQGPGGPEEDERGRFERGGWAHFDDEASTVMDEIYQRADAFLFGRRTYEIFAGSWGSWADPGDSPIWTALNTLPKHVASTTLTDPRWANTTVLSGDVAAAVGELKAKPGRELQVHGSGRLVRWLLDNDLVDEMNLFIFPVVVRPGHAAIPRRRPGLGPRTGGIAGDPERYHDPGPPAHWASAVCNRHHVTQVPQSVRVDILKARSAKLNPDP